MKFWRLYFVIQIIFNGYIGVTQACLWQGNENAYWPSNIIPTCFVAEGDSDENQLAIEHARRAVEDLNNRTAFRFTGMGRCTEHNGQHQIRIRLTELAGNGFAYGRGPEAGLLDVSADVARYSVGSREISPDHIFNTTQHEIMHLLGIRHDHAEYRIPGSKNFNDLASDGNNYFYFGEFTDQSTMAPLSGLGATEHDIICMNLIASRRMHLQTPLSPTGGGVLADTEGAPTGAPTVNP